MFGVAPPDDAIFCEPVTLVTPAAPPVAAEIVIFGAEPVSVMLVPAVNAVRGVVTSAEFGMVPAVMLAPLILGATPNVYAKVPPNDACARLVGFICDAKMPFAPMFVLSMALPHD